MFNYYANIRLAMIRLPTLIMLIAVIGLPIQAIAQHGTHKDADELSKELVNPVAPQWVINSFLNFTEKDGDITNESRTSTVWLIQPVMPVPLDNSEMGLTLMNRPSLPIILKDPVPQTNAMGEFSGFDNV